MVKVVKEAHDASCVIKKTLKNPFDPHTRWFNCLEEMKMMWAFGILQPLWMALGQNKDKGIHTHIGLMLKPMMAPCTWHGEPYAPP